MGFLIAVIMSWVIVATAGFVHLAHLPERGVVPEGYHLNQDRVQIYDPNEVAIKLQAKPRYASKSYILIF